MIHDFHRFEIKPFNIPKNESGFSLLSIPNNRYPAAVTEDAVNPSMGASMPRPCGMRLLYQQLGTCFE